MSAAPPAFLTQLERAAAGGGALRRKGYEPLFVGERRPPRLDAILTRYPTRMAALLPAALDGAGRPRLE